MVTVCIFGVPAGWQWQVLAGLGYTLACGREVPAAALCRCWGPTPLAGRSVARHRPRPPLVTPAEWRAIPPQSQRVQSPGLPFQRQGVSRRVWVMRFVTVMSSGCLLVIAVSVTSVKFLFLLVSAAVLKCFCFVSYLLSCHNHV